jgi:hypothetical protein
MPAPVREHPLAHVIGRPVPGGEYCIAPYESWLAHDALYSPPAAVPHPVMAFIAAQRGMGCTVAELFELLESSIDDGPLLASTSIDLERDLATDERYTVTGEIVGLVRKHGAALGDFDLATCRFEVRDGAGDLVAALTNVYAIRRTPA